MTFVSGVASEDLVLQCRRWGQELGLALEVFAAVDDEALLDRLRNAAGEADAAVVGGSVRSPALAEAVAVFGGPVVEVHEGGRPETPVEASFALSVYGRREAGYRWALRHLVESDAWPFETHRYGPDPEHVGDLRLPLGDGPHPVVIVIHGGFWRDHFQRDLMDAVAVDLARRGWATWNVEYRRVGAGGGWPATCDDVVAAFDHLAELAARGAPLDARVVALGHSAGGHLALWLAARGAPSGPAAVVSLAGVCDLAEGARTHIGDDAVEGFMRVSPDADAHAYALASPVELLPIGVPQLLIHGDADSRVPLDQSRRYAEAARAAGDRCELVVLPGVDHFDVIEPRSDAWQEIAGRLDELWA